MKVKLAATQMACDWDREVNLDRAEQLVRQAAAEGANVILIQELFADPYFCPDQKPEYFDLAMPLSDNPILNRFSSLAAELGVVLPISLFERTNQAFFNSVVMIDADGSQLGVYRKSHIPQGPGYEEKFYFSPGDTGFKVWQTAFGKIGIGICWDQWFPEAARAMVLQGAEMILYPTAIGSEPEDPSIDSKGHWQRAMQGHAASNMVPVVASNRIGAEQHKSAEMQFYGSSFITDHTGKMIAEMDRSSEGFAVAEVDLAKARRERASWGLFRDRRPELYGQLAGYDGVVA